jgi:hypothetical protein
MRDRDERSSMPHAAARRGDHILRLKPPDRGSPPPDLNRSLLGRFPRRSGPVREQLLARPARLDIANQQS